MKDIHQVLRQKELDMMRVRREVEALRFAIPLLAEEADPVEAVTAAPQTPSAAINLWPLRLETILPDDVSPASVAAG